MFIVVARRLTWVVGCLVSVCVQLFDKSTPYDDDDKDADRIYQAVDDRMDGRRKRRYAGIPHLACTAGTPYASCSGCGKPLRIHTHHSTGQLDCVQLAEWFPPA